MIHVDERSSTAYRTIGNTTNPGLSVWFHQGPSKQQTYFHESRQFLLTFPDDIQILPKNQKEELLQQAGTQPLDPDESLLRRKRAAYSLGILHDRCSAIADKMGVLTSKLFGYQLITFLAAIVILAIGMLIQAQHVDSSPDSNEKDKIAKEQAEKLSSLDRQLNMIETQLTNLRQDYDSLSRRVQDAAAVQASTPSKPKKRSRRIAR